MTPIAVLSPLGRSAASLTVVGLLSTTGYAQAVRIEDLQTPVNTGWLSSPWDARSSVVVPGHVEEPTPASAAGAARSTAGILRTVRDRTGLTWEQTARLFGVSRRAVHLWASGGRMTAANEEALLRLATLLSSMDGASPLDTRRAVLAQLEAERGDRASADTDLNRPAATWSVESGHTEPR